jgi:hypothetical protein
MSSDEEISPDEGEEIASEEVGKIKIFRRKSGKQGSMALSFNSKEVKLFKDGKIDEAIESYRIRKPDWIVEKPIELVGDGPAFRRA